MSIQQVQRSRFALAFETLRAIIALHQGRMGDPDLQARSRPTGDKLATAATWATEAIRHAQRSGTAEAFRFPPKCPLSPESVRPHLKVGANLIFRYPKAFTSLPEYSAHRDQEVVLVRPLIVGQEYDFEGDPMYEVLAADGWRAQAFGSELEPVEARALAKAFASRYLDQMGADVLAAVVEENRTYLAGACATHDYADANMFMLEAWNTVLGRPPLMLDDVEANAELAPQYAEETALWNNAWEIATAEELPQLLDRSLEQIWGFNDDDDFAHAEGWAIQVDSNRHVRCVAKPLPGGSPSGLQSDDDVRVHVMRCAEAGSLLHRRAVSRIRSKSPDEYRLMRDLYESASGQQ